MKVGTDSVLLGAWVNVSGAETILDIGTGTGVIALMMAQRSRAKITAIEIEKNAAEEALRNARNSKWKNRISILNLSLQEFLMKNSCRFDLIVSNPPFFINSQKSNCSNLSLAKHSDLLSLPDLAHGTANLLKHKGRMALVLPLTTALDFIKTADKEKLFISRMTEVKPKSMKNPHRLLMEFTTIKTVPEKTCLTIHNDDGFVFTDDYKKLTREFYLNF